MSFTLLNSKDQLQFSDFSSIVQDGPMVDTDDELVRFNITKVSLARRAQSKTSETCLETNLGNADAFENQVGGYKPDNVRKIFLKSHHFVLKPLQTKNRGIKEVAFYEAIQIAKRRTNIESDSELIHRWLQINMMSFRTKEKLISKDSTDLMLKRMKHEIELLRRVASFVPPYHGVVQLKHEGISTDSCSYMLLDDLSYKCRRPCILDLKMGCQTYEPDASIEKIRQEVQKYSKQRDFGFRIVGMKIYEREESNEKTHVFDKYYGYSLNSWDKVLDSFRTFFYAPMPIEKRFSPTMLSKMSSSMLTCKYNILVKLLSNLSSLQKWFEVNDTFSFYASSLLTVFDSKHSIDKPIYEHKDTGSDAVDSIAHSGVHMIDFCHVRRESGGQPGYLHGIKTLIQMWKVIQNELKIAISCLKENVVHE